MRELLVISPFNLPFVTSVVIVMSCSSSVLKSLFEVNLLSLREPSASGLSPSMIELKVDVVQMAVRAFTVGDLVVLSGNVALFLKVLGTNLGDVHINHVGVVTVEFHHLVWVLTIDIDVVIWADVLVR